MQMRQIGLVLIMIIANATFLARAGAANLSACAWQYRPLIVVAPAGDDTRLRKQSLALSYVEEEMRDRNIVLVEIVGSDVYTRHCRRLLLDANALRKRLGVYPDQFAVVLVGKDTGIKFRSSSPVDMAFIFSLIDSMPIRQQEMRGE